MQEINKRVILPDSKNCVSCNNCIVSCRHNAIELKYDSLGQTYPEINPQACVQCRMCERNCPDNTTSADYLFHNPIKCYAIKAKKEVLMNSSSGGIATVLSEKAIDDGWIVVGAAFDDFPVCRHIIVDNRDDLPRLQKSKYMYSHLDEVLPQLKERIRKDRGTRILFFGVPCQIAAAKNFLRNYDNILYVDLLCHGTMPDFIFPKYIKGLESRFKIKGKDYLFRGDKYDKDYIVFRIPELITTTNTYIKLKKWNKWYLVSFLKGRAYKNKCYACNYIGLTRTGDLTIGDFWGLGVYKNFDYAQEDGVSVVLANTQRGEEILIQIKNTLKVFEERDIAEAIPKNQTLSASTPKPAFTNLYLYLLKCCPASLMRSIHWINYYYEKIYHGIRRRILKLINKP